MPKQCDDSAFHLCPDEERTAIKYSLNFDGASWLWRGPLPALVKPRGTVGIGQVDLHRHGTCSAEHRAGLDLLLEPHEHLFDRSQLRVAQHDGGGGDVDRGADLHAIDAGGKLVHTGMDLAVIVDHGDRGGFAS